MVMMLLQLHASSSFVVLVVYRCNIHVLHCNNSIVVTLVTDKLNSHGLCWTTRDGAGPDHLTTMILQINRQISDLQMVR